VETHDTGEREKSLWAELEGQPISEVHDAIVKKLKGTPEALWVDERSREDPKERVRA
jgi:hypothetical protein